MNTLLAKLRALLRRRDLEAEMAEEMRQHLEQRIQEKLADGLAPDEARYAAQREFGGLVQMQEQCRDERRFAWLEHLAKDARFAARSLRKNPGFTAVAVLTLALGIGANTALFSTFKTLVLQPLTLPQSDRLVRIWASNSIDFNHPYVSWPRYEFIRDHQTSFANVAASVFTAHALTRTGADPEQLTSLQISATFLPTLGVSPLHGRNFTREEDTAGGPNVAILSYECWQTYFGGRGSLVGEKITLNGAPYDVVGILPPALSNPFNAAMIFVPRVFEVVGTTPEGVRNGASYVGVTARLKDGVSFERAAAEVKTLAENYKTAHPERLDGNKDNPVKPFAEELVGDIKPTFYLLLAAVGFVMLIACANIASLFLGRLSARHKEIAVRLSIGATRAQLVRQFLLESILFSAVAGVIGVLLAWWAIEAIQRLATNQLPTGTTLSLDGVTLAFTVGVSALSAVLVGLVPALQASRADVAEVLRDTARTAAGGTRGARFRSSLIVGQVALSVVLLVGAALLLVSFVRLQRAPAGFEPRGVATAFVRISGPRYSTTSQQAEFFAQLAARLESMPQVKSAAVGYGVPLTNVQVLTSYAIDGRPLPPLAERALTRFNNVSEHYFATLGIPLREGRVFNERDNDKVPQVCVINESFARRLFPDGTALGKTILRGLAETRCEIVGIVGDVKSAGLNAPPPDEMYQPARQFARTIGTLVVRLATPKLGEGGTDGDPAALQPVIRSTLASIDGTVPFTLFTTMESALGQSLGVQRITAWLTAIFAGVALLLSAVGLYSVLAYAITQRTNEIGLRMALGAQRQEVIVLVLRSGLKLVAFGLVLGLAAAAGAARLMQTLLFAVQPLDPLIYGGVTVLFTVIALLACLVPSLRASRIDPIVALRSD
jgi:predicted permease